MQEDFKNFIGVYVCVCELKALKSDRGKVLFLIERRLLILKKLFKKLKKQLEVYELESSLPIGVFLIKTAGE
jgi:hypothetical protein